MTEPAAGGLSDEGLGAASRLFGVPAGDVAPLLAARQTVCREPGSAAQPGPVRSWVDDGAARLVAAMGEPSPGPGLGGRPPAPPDVTAYLPVLVFAQVLPATLTWHRERGVPAAVSAASLSDVGRMLARNRRWFGEPGLGDELAGWLTRHLYGALFELGRLQYERVLLGEGAGVELRAAGFPCGPGDLVLNVHIPEVGGPLAPGAVDASLATARAFFRRRFPAERYAVAVCHSWLLDPQLSEYRPADGNLMSFQRRFTVGAAGSVGSEDGDQSVRRFVFGDAVTPLADLPRATSLQRAVLRHLRAGRHWQVRSGWLPWP